MPKAWHSGGGERCEVSEMHISTKENRGTMVDVEVVETCISFQIRVKVVHIVSIRDARLYRRDEHERFASQRFTVC